MAVNSFPVYAQEGSAPVSEDSIVIGETPLQESAIGNTSVWIVLRMVLILALAALAIYGVVFFIKRLARPPQAKDPHLKVLASIPLPGETFAAVISIGSKAWLVGGGSGAGLSLISEIVDQDSLETMLLDDARKNDESGTNRILDFKSLLNRFGRNPAAGNKNDFENQMDSLRKQRERLNRLQ